MFHFQCFIPAAGEPVLHTRLIVNMQESIRDARSMIVNSLSVHDSWFSIVTFSSSRAFLMRKMTRFVQLFRIGGLIFIYCCVIKMQLMPWWRPWVAIASMTPIFCGLDTPSVMKSSRTHRTLGFGFIFMVASFLQSSNRPCASAAFQRER